MTESHILIVAVDGLRATALGAYGNAADATPSLDRFAAQGLVLDACLATSTELEDIYGALWQSRHPLRTSARPGAAPSLIQLHRDWGYRASLVTDDARLLELPAAADFDKCVCIAAAADGSASDTSDSAGRPSQRLLSDTAQAQIFAAACDAVAAIGTERTTAPNHACPPQLIWVHTRGMYGPWDAPREFQRSLLEEGDPPPVEAIEPPDFRVTDRDDPDTAFRYACAYAAQAIILDTCWHGLMEAVAAAGSERDWLIMLIGVRGFPLGEHDQVGGIDQRLYAEQLHVPWLIRFPDGRARLTRSARLVTHVDLLPTLAMYKEASSGHPAGATATGSSPPCVSTQSMDGMSLLPIAQGSTAPRRDGLISAAPAGNRALRTDCWSYRQGAPSDSIMGGGEELFVRPDDRWEANDVATRCRDVAKGLDQVIDELCRQIAKDGPMPACELADELRG